VSIFLWRGSKIVANTTAKISAKRNGLKIKNKRIEIHKRKIDKK
jgi:hypothetical protein